MIYANNDFLSTEKQGKQGKLSLIFGAISFGILFVPYLNILSIPFAIAGLVLGIKSLKGNSNTKGILGVIFSSLTIFLVLLAVILIAAWVGFY